MADRTSRGRGAGSLAVGTACEDHACRIALDDGSLGNAATGDRAGRYDHVVADLRAIRAGPIPPRPS